MPANSQRVEIIRGCRGYRERDTVEVALAYDMTGNTALPVANLLFEMVCVFLGVKLRQ
jgi:hypothetical protein